MAEVKQEILRRIDLVSLIGEYVTLKKRGNRLWGLCPFHEEKTPSFCVTPEKDLYYCFGCQKGGDLINFFMEIENVEFQEALRLLADKAGVSFQPSRGESKSNQALRELYTKVCGSFQYLLREKKEGEGARGYLQRRGLLPAAVEKYRLGYAPQNRSWLAQFLKEKGGYSSDFLRRSGLFSERSGRLVSFFYERIIFPIENTRGDVIAFGGRALSDVSPKYINSPETDIYRKGENLFGIRQAIPALKETRQAIVVEGYMDVLSVVQSGFENCVAPLGTALTSMQVKLLKRYISEVALLFDGDEAGVNAAVKAIPVIEAAGLPSTVVLLDEGRDPADYAPQPDALAERLEQRQDGFSYLLRVAGSQQDLSSPQGKEKAFSFLFPFFKAVQSDVKRDGCFQIFAEAAQIDPASVRRDYERAVRGSMSRKPPMVFEPKKPISDDLYLMIAVAANLEYFSEVRNTLSPEELSDPRAKQIYISLEDCYRNELHSMEDLWSKLDDQSIKSLILQKVSSEEFSVNARDIIEDGVSRIKQRGIISKRASLIRNLSQLRGNDPQTIQREKELQTEIMVLNDQLEHISLKR
jgi:DNA primase